MHQDYIGLALLEHVAHSGEYAGGDVIQVLSLFHDVQVKIRRDLKYTEHLVQHLAVLPDYTRYCLKLIWMLLDSFTSWAIFMASGRVPNTSITVFIFLL